MADTLREQQMAFAAHVRDPQAHPAPAGIEERRVDVSCRRAGERMVVASGEKQLDLDAASRG